MFSVERAERAPRFTACTSYRASCATAGKLDDNMLFYLLSRGIDRATAQQLLKWAFLEDVVSRIQLPGLRKHIEASLAGQMQETAALKELI